MSDTGLEVYKSITNIIKAMSEEGIGKNKKAGSGSFEFNFRGIDDVMNVLSPILARENLIIFPRITKHERLDRKDRKGNPITYVLAHMDYDFISSVDGSKHTVSVVGEAMDTGDKATNKAMSIALKYAAFQTFFIPTEVTAQDSDSDIHQVQSLPELKNISVDMDTFIKGEIGKGIELNSVIKRIRNKFFVGENMIDIMRKSYVG